MRPFSGSSEIVFSVTTADIAALRVSTSAAVPTTVIDSAVPVTASVSVRPASCATASVTRSTAVPKPVRLARVSYVPGGRPGSVK